MSVSTSASCQCKYSKTAVIPLRVKSSAISIRPLIAGPLTSTTIPSAASAKTKCISLKLRDINTNVSTLRSTAMNSILAASPWASDQRLNCANQPSRSKCSIRPLIAVAAGLVDSVINLPNCNHCNCTLSLAAIICADNNGCQSISTLPVSHGSWHVTDIGCSWFSSLVNGGGKLMATPCKSERAVNTTSSPLFFSNICQAASPWMGNSAGSMVNNCSKP